MNTGVTQSLAEAVRQHPESAIEIKMGMDHYTKQYRQALQEADTASVAHAFHKVVDAYVAEVLKDPSVEVTCKRGCAHCCHIQVAVTPDEADLLRLASQDLEIDKARLEQQAVYKDIYDKLPYKQRRCVFLGDDNDCRVYEVRPIACRKYLVGNDPKLCNTKKYPSGDAMVLSVNKAEIVASAVYNLRGCEPMAVELLKTKSEVVVENSL